MFTGYKIDIVIVVIVIVVLLFGFCLIEYFHHLLEFTLHQRTQQENRKKPSSDIESEVDEALEDIIDEEAATTTKSILKTTSTKSSISKSKSKNREGMKIKILFFSV